MKIAYESTAKPEDELVALTIKVPRKLYEELEDIVAKEKKAQRMHRKESRSKKKFVPLISKQTLIVALIRRGLDSERFTVTVKSD